jgi:hypothetical protein
MNKEERRAGEAAEMRFLHVARYTRKDKVHNDNIQQKLKIFNLNDRIHHNRIGTNILCVWIQEELPNKFYSINQQDTETLDGLGDVGKDLQVDDDDDNCANQTLPTEELRHRAAKYCC